MPGTRTRSRYFLVAHLVLLTIVLLAFTPTFFLRSVIPQPPILDMPALPGLFVVHGIILILWYVLLVVQPVLIQRGRIALHRRSGQFGVVLAAAVLVSTAMMVQRFPGRMHALSEARGIPVAELEPGLNTILWLDLFMLLLFVGFFSAGIINRYRADAHKRHIYFAGIALVFAAVARLGGIVSFLVDLDVGLPISQLILLGLTGSLLLHDKLLCKRISSTSWICFIAYWAATILSVVFATLDEAERLSAVLMAL